jgi:hypothetical protein
LTLHRWLRLRAWWAEGFNAGKSGDFLNAEGAKVSQRAQKEEKEDQKENQKEEQKFEKNRN